MSLQHAILGFLSWQPMTGYDLKTQAFDDSIAHFWPADQAQIYRTLDKLAEQGLIHSEIEMQLDRPNRKVYSITEAGRAELRTWLHTTPDLPIHREAFLIQLFFGDHLHNAELVTQLDAQLALHQQQLAVYEKINVLDRPCEPQQLRSLHLNAMTLDMGIRLEKMYIEWIETCKAALRTLPDKNELALKSTSEGTDRP
ncbi:MAG: PadR family transcriptional regulator [Anaerolineae bacterium]|nr:PadR family transcriptional regulator [Anaerolineae bacterium]